jgi:hypothetical protein
MQHNITCLTFLVVLAVSSAINAQEEPEFPVPEKEHQWLKQFVGQWDSESEAKMSPDQPPMKCTGTMSSRMLGGFWLVAELTGEMPGMTVTAIQTIGYDPAKKKYVGTWVDSVTTYMWKYEGTVDDSGKTLVLEAEGPNFMAGDKIMKFRDAYTFKSKDHIVTTSSAQSEDGSWVQFMTGHFRRSE